MKKLSFAIALLLLLPFAACSSGEAPSAPFQLDYSQFGKIDLDVQNLSVVDQSAGQPSTDNSFHPTIAEAIRRWSEDRLQAVGTAGDGTVTIQDASLTTQALPMEHGISGWFERQQAAKYIGHAAASVEVHNDKASATATAEATHTVSIPEDAPADEKQKAYRALLTGLMKDLGRNLNQSIHEHMQSFITTAPESPVAPPEQPAMPQEAPSGGVE